MSLNIQTNIKIPHNNMTFRANGKGIRTLFNNGTDMFVHSKQNSIERISGRLRGYISKFKEAFGAIKCKNTADELSKDELAILSKDEIALWKNANSKNSFDELTEEEFAVMEKINAKRAKDAFGDDKGIDITTSASEILKKDLGLNTNKNISEKILPYDLLSKEEQIIFDGIGEKTFDECTKEEINVLNKYTKLLQKDLQETLGTKTPNKEYAKNLKKFLDLN